MCLAIPGKIVEMDENGMGVVDMEGTRRSVSLLLQEDARVGDYVIVHAGFAIHRIDEQEAMESLRILRESLSVLDDPGEGEIPSS
jgi:hydrogenase expression/formation protein HypC